MKNLSTSELTKFILTIAAILATTFCYGAKYTAVSSGNYSSSSTWHSGAVPPTLVTSDTIIIPSGITVNVDNNIILNGNSALLTIAGTLTANSNTTLTLNTNSLTGTGNMVMNHLVINVGSGNVARTTSNVTINGSLQLNSGTLNSHHTNLILNGPVTGSGQLSGNIATNITVNTAGGIPTGLQFAPGGQVLNNFTLWIGSGNSVKLNSDLTINGTLILNGGSNLNVNGKTLTLNHTSQLSGTGAIISNSSSNLIINSTSGIPSLNISGTVGNLTTNSGFNNIILGSDVIINGTLHLKSGTLASSNHDLQLNGQVLTTGNGAIYTTPGTDITINNSTGTSGVLNFGGSSQVNNLTINVGQGAEARIAGNLMVSGALELNSGTLNIHYTNFSINGQVTGTGALSGNSSTILAINTTGGLSTPLKFRHDGQVLKNLKISVGTGNMATLASDLSVNNLQFVSGKLNIGSHKLTVDVSGSISGTNPSSYIITASGGLVEKYISPGAPTPSIFPIGTVTHFAPAVVGLNSASSGGNIQVGVVEEVKDRGTEGELLGAAPLVNATWHVHSDILNNLDLNLKVMWPQELEVNGFNRNDAFISHFTDGVWDEVTCTAATTEAHNMYGLQRTGINSLSPFTVFSRSTITAVGDIDEISKLNLYPNPAIDNITIETATAEPFNMVIYNSKGQLMSHFQLSEASSTISVKDFSNGNYFVKVYNNYGSSIKQFTKL